MLGAAPASRPAPLALHAISMKRPALLLAVLVALAACGKPQKDSPKTPIDLCNQLKDQGVVSLCESKNVAAYPGPDRPLAHVKATFQGSDATLDIFSFSTRELGDKYMTARDLVVKQIQLMESTSVQAKGQQPRKWVFDTYKSKAGTLAAGFKYSPDGSPADQANRIKSLVESVP